MAAPDHVYVTKKYTRGPRLMYKHEVSWEADDTDGSIADVEIPDNSLFQGLYLRRVITDPGTPAPTNLYDIVLNDEYGLDLAGSSLANRAAAASEEVNFDNVPAVSAITAVFTNNLVNSAQGKIVFIFGE